MDWQPGREATDADSYDQAVLSESQMLLEFIAGRPDLTVRDLKVADPAKPDQQMVLAEVTARLSKVEDALDEGRALDPAERTLLLSVRDALNAIVRPASGLTVAYTALVLRTSRGHFSKARASLAQRAFPGLVTAAWWHRRLHMVMLGLATCLTLWAVWESTKVALGQSLLRSRGDLRIEQQAIAAEEERLEAALDRDGVLPLDKVDLGTGPRPTARLCDRPRLLAAYVAKQSGAAVPEVLYDNPEEQDVCDRDIILMFHFGSSVAQMRLYRSDWPSMVGGVFTWIDHPAQALERLLPAWGAASSNGGTPAQDVAQPADKDADVEYSIAPELLVTGNYLLPVLFAMLGAAAFAIRDFYGKAASNLLLPGDRMLSWVRLILGVLIGACIGLFFSSGQPAAPAHSDNLLGALTLSASGLAFIGGYGVEGVFAMLNALVGRVFDPKAAAG